MHKQAPTPLPLRDIHLPDAVSWWPPAYGWWLLLVGLPVLLVLCFAVYKRLTRKTALKSARKHLLLIKQDSQLSAYQKLCEISTLLRRTAISYFPRAESASLTGEKWLAFLDSSLPARPFSQGVGRLLISAAYRSEESVKSHDIDTLIEHCEAWLNALGRRKS